MTDFGIYGGEIDAGVKAQNVPGFDKKDAERVTYQGAQLTPKAGDFFGAHTTEGAGKVLSADELNERFGRPGYLTFDRSEQQASADYKSRVVARRAFQDEVLSGFQLSGADSMWQSLKGGVLDPIALPTYFIGLGELNAGKAGVTGALAVGRNRLIASGAVRAIGENAIGTAAYETVNFGLTTSADEDYDFGQALDNLAVGTVFGAGMGGLGGHLRYGGAVKAEAGRVSGMKGVIASAAAKYGVDPAYLDRQASIESGYNAAAQNPKSSAGGLFQFTDSTWNAMGGGDKFDPVLNAERGAQLAANNSKGLSAALGRTPTGGELYLAHQQGLGGAKALLRQPDARAVDVIANLTENGKRVGEAAAAERIRLNGGKVDMTAGQFASMWTTKFGESGSGGVSSPVVTGSGVPSAVALLSPSERAGSFEMAMDQFLSNDPVDLSALMPKERPLRSVDAAGAPLHIEIPSRALHEDVAVTTRGTEIPVRYALVELGDVVTSHDNDMNLRGDYPQDLQPRQRDRAGAIANNRALESNLNPQRLIRDVAAEGGAPIIGPDGVVESGNGRTIALRRSAMAGGESYGKYRAALEAQGYDTAGMKHPALMRVNTSDMSHGERIRFTKEANLDTVERMGAGEQARSDAAKLPHDVLGLINGPDLAAASNRDFVKAYIRHVAPEAVNSMVTKDGAVSAEAIRRIEASVMTKAYDNPALIDRLFEDSDNNIKSIGTAMKQAAPGWARLKALIDAGQVSPEVDVSADLNAALNLIMEARDGKLSLKDLISERIDQTDIMTGDAMSEAQIVFLRAMFKDDGFKVGRSIDDMVKAMDAYTRQAEQIGGGTDLFGNGPLKQVQEAFENSYQSIDANIKLGGERVFTFRPDEKSVTETRLFGGDAGKPQRPVAEAGNQGPKDGQAGRGSADDTQRPVNAQALISADPELSQLQDLVTRTEMQAGLEPTINEKPETLAEAMRAAAFCLIEGGQA